jgi:hypothetical protein
MTGRQKAASSGGFLAVRAKVLEVRGVVGRFSRRLPSTPFRKNAAPSSMIAVADTAKRVLMVAADT